MPDLAAKFASWAFGPVATTPLRLWRGLSAASIFMLAAELAPSALDRARLHLAHAIALETEGETLGFLDLALVQRHPRCLQGLLVVLAICLLVGRIQLVSATIAWLVSVGLCRRSFPAVAPHVEVLSRLLFWSMLTNNAIGARARSREVPRMVFVIFVLDLFGRATLGQIWSDCAAAVLSCASCATAVYCIIPSTEQVPRRILGAPVVLSLVGLLCGPGAAIVRPLSDGAAAALQRIAWDLALLSTSPRRVERFDARIRMNRGRAEPPLFVPGLDLKRYRLYLGSLGQPGPIPVDIQRQVRIRGLVRQMVANRLCSTWPLAGTVDVYGGNGIYPSLSFYCEKAVGHLVPRVITNSEVLPDETTASNLENSATLYAHAGDEQAIASFLERARSDHRHYLIRSIAVARLRFDLREFDEALSLLEAAQAVADERERRIAKLEELISYVRSHAQHASMYPKGEETDF